MAIAPRFFPPRPEGFDAGGSERLPWGTTPAALRASLEARGLLSEGAQPLTVLGRCTSAYGLATISFESGVALREDRPVMGLTYHLAVAERSRSGVPDPAFWAKPIQGALGEPAGVQGVAEDEDPPGADGVLLYATWSAPPFEVGLSVFGGQREEVNGRCAGYLYITWTDREAAAGPYLAAIDAAQARLEAVARNSSEWQAVDLEREIPAIDEGEDPAERRVARALTGDGLLDTPSAWRGRLRDTQVAYWRSKDFPLCGISTRHETVAFAPGDPDLEVGLLIVEAGRFPGYVELRAGNLTLTDDEPSEALEGLASWLGTQLARAVARAGSRNDG